MERVFGVTVPRLRPARGSCNVTPSNAVDDAIAANIFIDVQGVLVRDGGTVSVARTIGSGVG